MPEEEKTQDVPVDQKDPDTTPQETTEDALQSLKEQVADAYIILMDKTKGGLFALGAQFGVSLNPMKSFAKDFLLNAETKTSDEGFFDKIGTNLKKQLLGKISGQSATLAYNQKDLNIMKVLISKGTKEELDHYLTMMVDEGKDPTKEQDPVSTKEGESIPDSKKDTISEIPTGTGAPVEAIINGCKYTFPLAGMVRLSSKYGLRTHPVTGEKNSMHTGIDLDAEQGDKILSMTDGEVVENRKTDLGGREIHIKGPDNRIYCYLHMMQPSPLEKGTRVVLGQEIGLIGSTGSSTGSHLHLTIKENDKPIDPMAILGDVFDKDRLNNLA